MTLIKRTYGDVQAIYSGTGNTNLDNIDECITREGITGYSNQIHAAPHNLSCRSRRACIVCHNYHLVLGLRPHFDIDLTARISSSSPAFW